MMKSISYNEVGLQLELEDVEAGKNQSGNSKAANRTKGTKSYIMGICLVLSIILVIALGVYLICNRVHNESDAAASASGHRRMDTSPIASTKKQHFYVSSPNDPIPTSLRLIDDPLIMEGYPAGEGCQALTDDIYNASAILANKIILSNAQQGQGGTYLSSDSESMVRSSRSSSSQTKMSITESSFDTNNQETDVDEADIMKSDSKHVFTAYGDMLVVWDVKSGLEMSLTKLPKIDVLSWKNGGYCDHDRKARITGLLLDAASERLVVIASGYSHRYRYDYNGPKPVLGGIDDTRVFLYDVSSPPDDGSELPLLSTEKMNGVYKSARMVDGVAHVVRMSTINHYEHISSRLSRRRREYSSDTREMYITHAKSNAEQWLLRGFAKQLTEELRGGSGSGDCSAVTRLALYVSGDDLGDDYPSSVISNGNIIQSYVQISSFPIATPKNEKGGVDLNPSLSSSIFPSTNIEVYSSKNFLVVAGRGYHYARRRRTFAESTYFLSFRLDASSPSPALASAPGYLLNQFAMDEYEGYFRVATTEQAKWGCVKSPRRNSPCRWKMVSDSKSRLSVFKIPSTSTATGKMELIKVVDNLGVREEIKSVRFFDTKAFLVTFRTTDPLYSIDLTNPEYPTIADELKNISGYSSYLHPVPNGRLLAIGKEANETTGEVNGLQITLFNITNLQDVQLLQRHTIQEKWASSSAESDHLAFRYLPKSQLLILPISIRYDYWRTREGEKIEPFDGFQVFSVTDDNIEPRFNISMTTPSEMKSGCWYGAYLPARSMVFDGNVTVAKGHGYNSYDLTTETLRWRHNLDFNLRGEQCSNYW